MRLISTASLRRSSISDDAIGLLLRGFEDLKKDVEKRIHSTEFPNHYMEERLSDVKEAFDEAAVARARTILAARRSSVLLPSFMGVDIGFVAMCMCAYLGSVVLALALGALTTGLTLVGMGCSTLVGGILLTEAKKAIGISGLSTVTTCCFLCVVGAFGWYLLCYRLQFKSLWLDRLFVVWCAITAGSVLGLFYSLYSLTKAYFSTRPIWIMVWAGSIIYPVMLPYLQRLIDRMATLPTLR